MAKKSAENFRKFVNFLKANRYSIIFSLVILVMALLMFFSSLRESPMNDELAHSFSGYSYIRKLEIKYNLEHPVLIKDLAGISMLALSRPHFPQALYGAISGGYWAWQWGLGSEMFYAVNTNPDYLLLCARLPMMVLGLLLAVSVYLVTKKYYGKEAGLLALILCAFSPNILAHSRYVATDVGISLFFFLSIFAFVNYLESPSKKSLSLFSFSFLGVLLTKYSFLALLPVLFLILLVRPFFEEDINLFEYVNYCFQKGIRALVAMIASFIGVAVIYEFQLIGMSASEFKSVITSYIPVDIYHLQSILLFTGKYLKGIPIYLTGMAYVLKHAVDGHTSFLMGKLYSKGVWYYFPMIFVYKNQISFLILLVALLICCLRLRKITFVELSTLIGVVVYFAVSIANGMNLGIRHLLPVLPLLFFLVGGIIPKIKSIFKDIKVVKAAQFAIWSLAILYALEAIFFFPYYTAYSNQLISNKYDSYKYFVDSNLDWGQGLKELGKYTKENKIDQINVDYFANGVPVKFYVPGALLWDNKTMPNPQGYFAVSATSFQFYPDKYPFLKGKEPIYEAGYSILVFKLT